MFEVHESARKNQPYEVRWNGGKTYCRCDSYRDAAKVALAMNMMRDRDATLEELRLIHAEIRSNT